MTDITELAQLKPGKYAILYRDNWDGEKNEYHTLAVLTEEGGWYDDEFNAELLKYQGDKILKVWPLDDGSNVIALVEALEKAQQRIAELESRAVKLPPKVDSSNVPFAAHTWNCCLDEVEKRLAAAGIKVEAE